VFFTKRVWVYSMVLSGGQEGLQLLMTFEMICLFIIFLRKESMMKDFRMSILLFSITTLFVQTTLAHQSNLDSMPSTSSQANARAQQNAFFSRFNPKHANISFQVGAFDTTQGNSQNIGIVDLIGDHFTVSHSHAQNVLVGVGYYVDGIQQSRMNWMFGLNAFYLPHTDVRGNVIQEQLFTNLSYRYSMSNFPVYVAAKTFITNPSDKYNVTLDVGIGPNFIRTSEFREYSLDGGVTIPDNAFSGQTRAVFSATLGIGVKFNHVFGRVPLEVGYRFFYLGQGSFDKRSSQFTNTLNTGSNYANALVLAVSL
jgi:hypothetical protein